MGMITAVRLRSTRPLTSSAWITARSRPRRRITKPNSAVQKAPVIQVNSTKNSARLAFSRGVNPLARRMSYISQLANAEVRKVREKNSARRRRAALRSRSGVMTGSSPDARPPMLCTPRWLPQIGPCLGQSLTVESEIAPHIDRLLAIGLQLEGRPPDRRLWQPLHGDVIYIPSICRNVGLDGLIRVQIIQIASGEVDNHPAQAGCRLGAGGRRHGPRAGRDHAAPRRPLVGVGEGIKHVRERDGLVGLYRGIRHPVSHNVVVDLLVGGYLDQLDTAPAPVALGL